MPSGLLLVSTTPITGIFKLFASVTAMRSWSTSITKRASGKPPISLIPPILRSSFSLARVSIKASFLVNRLKVPSASWVSNSFNLLIDPRMVL